MKFRMTVWQPLQESFFQTSVINECLIQLVKFLWEAGYLHSFQAPLHKVLIHYKEKTAPYSRET